MANQNGVLVSDLTFASSTSLADRIVKRFSFQFIEIKWTYKKESI